MITPLPPALKIDIPPPSESPVFPLITLFWMNTGPAAHSPIPPPNEVVVLFEMTLPITWACDAPVVRKYSVRPLNSLKTRHARLGKVRPVAWRFEPLSTGGTNRFGETTIRHNVQWAAILLPHPRGLWRLSGAQHIPAFLCSVAFSSACGEPVLTKAVS